jgi:hypothetical protein
MTASLTKLLTVAILAVRMVSPAHASVTDVWVVFKTHFDIGYTDMADNVVHKYRTRMNDQALAVVDRNRDLPPAQQFVWTIPGWPMHQILDWPEQTPERNPPFPPTPVPSGSFKDPSQQKQITRL